LQSLAGERFRSYKPDGEDCAMTKKDEPHEIEKLIALRKSAQETKAVAQVEAARKADDLAGKVRAAIVVAEQALREEITKANAAIKRGGCDEKFVFQSDPKSGAGLSASLTLSGGTGPLRDYALAIDAVDGKIVIKSAGMTMQLKITNVFEVTSQDWGALLTKMYASST
jgi:hypothetical protein